MTDVTLAASGLWLGTRTGAGGTATLTACFFLAAAHGSMGNSSKVNLTFLLPFGRTVRSYRPHLEERDPIRGDKWSHRAFAQLSYRHQTVS